ncbi:hypothetical protein [Sediminicurvatus halobius]|uniref:SnoaL-like domain-containing protein n=1 Tax=Sediminicurvatus halobius TaxID=2182432 RepID=A0A2U2N356_9GAMM|nr:hypothetical protein [Spiribacter halobius]PWG63540.1 hypothetical protein DEM34_08255 [Spiribacter halobius]UEX79580.1 hypothetical protein LMH63_08020 [Spiribacter halobius]
MFGRHHALEAAVGTRERSRLTAKELWRLLLIRPFDRAGWSAALGDDCHLRIGNRPPCLGKACALSALEHLLGRVDSVGTGFRDTWEFREAIILETDLGVGCDRDRPPLIIPCAVFARVTRDQVRDLRFYLDPSPIPSTGLH